MDLYNVSPDFHKDCPNFDGHDGFSTQFKDLFTAKNW